MAGGFDEPVLAVLREVFTEPTEAAVLRVGELLAAAPATFVVDQPAFVAELLDAAAAVSDAVADLVQEQLVDGPGRLVPILDQGAPEQLRDRAAPIAQTMRGRARSFYITVAERAEAKMQAEQRRQQLMRDLRPWP